jgi:hypothetical protein
MLVMFGRGHSVISVLDIFPCRETFSATGHSNPTGALVRPEEGIYVEVIFYELGAGRRNPLGAG